MRALLVPAGLAGACSFLVTTWPLENRHEEELHSFLERLHYANEVLKPRGPDHTSVRSLHGFQVRRAGPSSKSGGKIASDNRSCEEPDKSNADGYPMGFVFLENGSDPRASAGT